MNKFVCAFMMFLSVFTMLSAQDVEVFPRSEYTASVFSIAVSPDGKYLISGSGDNTLKLWDIATGRIIRTFAGHTGEVYSVVISPDGKYALSGSQDRTIKLWDIATGRVIRTFAGYSGGASSATFSPDGKHIFSGMEDGAILLWDIGTDKEIVRFIAFNDGEWITITPDGFYNASPRGDEYINVRIDGEVYGLDQFSDIFYQPEVVAARIQGYADPPAASPQRDIRQASIPPKVDITVNSMDARNGIAVLAIRISDQINSINGVRIEITVNGRLMGGNELQAAVSVEGITPGNTHLIITTQANQVVFTIPVRLEPGQNHIEVIAANEYSQGLGAISLF